MTYYEKMVRRYWDNIKESRIDGDSYSADVFVLDIGPTHFRNFEYNWVWKEAWEYTLMILQKIERIEDQIEWIDNAEAEFPEDVRSKKSLLASIKLALEDVKKGLNENNRW